MPLSDEPQQPRHQERGHESDSKKQVAGPSAIALKIRDGLKRYREKAKDAEYRKERRERLTIFGLFLAAGFALLQWSELRSTDHHISDQAEAARKQLIAMQRQLDVMTFDQMPWLGVSSAIAIPETPELGRDFTIRLTIKNSGRSPALKWAFNAGPNPTIMPATKFKMKLLERGEDGGMLPPNGDFPIDAILSGAALNAEQLARIQSKKDLIYIFGRTDYVDNLKRPHCLHICMVYGIDIKRLGFCPNANLMDEKCD